MAPQSDELVQVWHSRLPPVLPVLPVVPVPLWLQSQYESLPQAKAPHELALQIDAESQWPGVPARRLQKPLLHSELREQVEQTSPGSAPVVPVVPELPVVPPLVWLEQSQV